MLKTVSVCQSRFGVFTSETIQCGQILTALQHATCLRNSPGDALSAALPESYGLTRFLIYNVYWLEHILCSLLFYEKKSFRRDFQLLGWVWCPPQLARADRLLHTCGFKNVMQGCCCKIWNTEKHQKTENACGKERERVPRTVLTRGSKHLSKDQSWKQHRGEWSRLCVHACLRQKGRGCGWKLFCAAVDHTVSVTEAVWSLGQLTHRGALVPEHHCVTSTHQPVDFNFVLMHKSLYVLVSVFSFWWKMNKSICSGLRI